MNVDCYFSFELIWKTRDFDIRKGLVQAFHQAELHKFSYSKGKVDNVTQLPEKIIFLYVRNMDELVGSTFHKLFTYYI